MKKDVFLALALGIILGGTGAFLTLNLPAFFKKENLPGIKVISPPPQNFSPAKETLPSLSLLQPDNFSLSSSATAEIRGKTYPHSLVVGESDLETKTAESLSDGSFSLSLKLKEGTNEIYLTAYGEKGEQENKVLTLFYTDEKL